MDPTPDKPRGLIGLHQIPNLICVLRVIVTFSALAMLAEIHDEEGRWSVTCLVVITLAALSDRLDGFLAKRYGWSSKLGAVLDQISDKLVTLVLYCMLALWGAFPLWGVALIVFREMFVTCLRISANLDRIAILTSQAGRFKTFTQQVAVLIIFLHWAWPETPVAGLSVGQVTLWGGWAIFALVMLVKGKAALEAFDRVYSVERKAPDGTVSRSRADLFLVYASIFAMLLPLDVGGPLVVLTITLGTGFTYWRAYLWARRVRGRRGGAGRTNIVLSVVGSACVSVTLALVLDHWANQTALWTLVAVLSGVWAWLLSVSYRTSLKAT